MMELDPYNIDYIYLDFNKLMVPDTANSLNRRHQYIYGKYDNVHCFGNVRIVCGCTRRIQRMRCTKS
jgi:hypothetical protein